MTVQRRALVATLGLSPLLRWSKIMAAQSDTSQNTNAAKLVLSNFEGDEPYVLEGAGWRGFSDRVMGGISDAQLQASTIDGVRCARLTGSVTRESNGGFIQMAMYFRVKSMRPDSKA